MLILWIIIAAAAGIIAGGAITYLWTDRKCRSAINDVQTAYVLAEQRNATLLMDIERMRGETQTVLAEVTTLRKDLSTAQEKAAGLTADLTGRWRNRAEQKKFLDEANEKLAATFATVNRDALAKSSKAFSRL